MSDVNPEPPTTPQSLSGEMIADAAVVEGTASGAVATASASQDIPPGETPIYLGVDGLPARPPVGPQFACPYCGGRTSAMARCDQCRGPLDPLSRQATQNTMGPWFIRDEGHPFRPGCSYATLTQLVQRGKVTMETVLRGPTTRQFWTPLRRVPGVAHLLGVCHSCQAATPSDAMGCGRCGASFVVDEDRQNLGLGPVHLLPGQAPADRIATSTLTPSPTAPTTPPTPAVGLPPLVSIAGTPALSISRDRARLDRLEREASALKLSLGIAASVVVVLLAAFMLAVLDGRLGLGLGIAGMSGGRAQVPANTPAAGSAGPADSVQSRLGERAAEESTASIDASAPPATQIQTSVPVASADATAFAAAKAQIAKDTPDDISAAIRQLEAIAPTDATLAAQIADAIAAAKARLEQLKVRRGL